jgi:hypothetical protein
MSLNKTPSSVASLGRSRRGDRSGPRASEGPALCHMWYEDVLYGTILRVSEINMHNVLKMKKILRRGIMGFKFEDS